MDEKEINNVIIIGSGPAAWAAAIYAARAELNPLLFADHLANKGGQLMTTTEVENYPGMDHMMGPEMMEVFEKQAKRFGTRVIEERIESIDMKKQPFACKSSSGKMYYTHTVILATGAFANRLDIPGSRDDELWQKGVSACAVCDGALPMFRGKPMAVVGGGDSACEEALFLTKFASKVYLVHRRDKLRASKIMADRVLHDERIECIWNSEVIKVEGADQVEKIRVKNKNTQAEQKIEVGGLFFAIGHTPNTAFLGGQLKLDAQGYIIVTPGSTETSVEGIFAAGDVADPKYRQAITSAGSGCMAALDAERWIAHKLQKVEGVAL